MNIPMRVDDAICLGVVNEVTRRDQVSNSIVFIDIVDIVSGRYKGFHVSQGIIGVGELCTVGFFENMKIACRGIGKFGGFDQSFGFGFFPIAGVIGPIKCVVGYWGCISKNCGGFFCRIATKVILKMDKREGFFIWVLSLDGNELIKVIGYFNVCEIARFMSDFVKLIVIAVIFCRSGSA